MSRVREYLSPLSLAAYVTIGVIWWQITLDNENPLAFLGVPRAPLVHGTMAAFLAAFLFCSEEPRSSVRWVGFCIAAAAAYMAVALSAHGTGPVLFVILAAMLRIFLDLKRAVAVLVGINVLLGLEMFLVWNSPRAPLSVVLYGGFQAFALLTMHVAVQAEQSRDELQTINAELRATRELLALAATDRERLRLSRELHDVSGHALTALKLTLRNLQSRVGEPYREDVGQALELADQLLRDIRTMVGRIREQGGVRLRPVIERLVEPFPGPDFRIDIDPEWTINDPEIATSVIRATTEVITNVVRHAEASECHIRITAAGEGIEMQCRDDGRGGARPDRGFGLKGLAERARAAGGTCRISSEPGHGTLVEVTWPLT